MTDELHREIEMLRARIAELESTVDRNQNEPEVISGSRSIQSIIFDLAPTGLGLADLQGKILACNETMATMLGYSPREIEQRFIRELYADLKDRDRILLAVYNEGFAHDVRLGLRHKDGRTVSALVDFSVVEIKGEPAIVFNVTERDLPDDTVVDQTGCEDKFKALFNGANDGILLEEQGRFVACNAKTLEMMGCSREMIIGLTPLDISPTCQPCGTPSEQLIEERRGQVLSGEPQKFDWQCKRSDGTLLDVELSLSGFELAGKHCILAILRDITQKKLSTQSLERDEATFEALYNLHQMEDQSERELLDFALLTGVQATQSEMGFLCLVDKEKDELNLYACCLGEVITRELPGLPKRLSSLGGVWQEAVRTRMAVVDNQCAPYIADIFSAGVNTLPERAMVFPIFDQENNFLLATAAGKRSDYSEDDLRRLSLVMQDAQRILRQKKYERDLLKAHNELEARVKSRTVELDQANEGLWEANKNLLAEIDERKKTEGELKASQKMFEAVVESTPLGISLIDEELNLVMVNRKFEEMFGYELTEIPNLKKCFERFFPDLAYRLEFQDKFMGAIALARKTGVEIDPLERHVNCRNGSVKFIRFCFTSIGTQTVTVAMDLTERKEAEDTLREYRRALESSDDLIAVVDENYVYRLVNNAFLRERGAEREDILGHAVADVLGPWVYGKMKPHLDKCFQGQVVEYEMTLDHPDLEKRTYLVRYYPIKERNGQVGRVVGMIKDISGFRQTVEERQQVFSLSLDPLSVADFEGHFKELNPAWERVLGWSVEEMKSRPWIEFVHPEDKQETAIMGAKLSQGESVLGFDNRYITKDGQYRWLSWNAFPDVEKKVIYAVARDVTERKEMEAEMFLLATTDPLTGAHNRRHFMDRVKVEISRSWRYKSSMGLIVMDVDRFKQINDTFGHDIGDMALKALVEKCMATLRTTDIFGRLGGEEFGAVLVQTDPESALGIAERLRRALQAMRLETPNGEVCITVSMGLVLVEHGKASLDELLKRADVALYQAKNKGRNQVVLG